MNKKKGTVGEAFQHLVDIGSEGNRRELPCREGAGLIMPADRKRHHQ